MYKKGVLFFLCVCLLGGCAKKNVDVVKNMVFEEYSDAISVGQALDNFAGCQAKTQKWTALESSNGAQIVEFSCVAQDMQEFVSSLKAYAEETMPDHLRNADGNSRAAATVAAVKNALDISKMEYRIQFTLSKDKQSSQINFTGVDYIWRDGKKKGASLEEDKMLTRIYSNKTIKDEFNVSSYKKLPNFAKNVSAMSVIKLYGEASKE